MDLYLQSRLMAEAHVLRLYSIVAEAAGPEAAETVLRAFFGAFGRGVRDACGREQLATEFNQICVLRGPNKPRLRIIE